MVKIINSFKRKSFIVTENVGKYLYMNGINRSFKIPRDYIEIINKPVKRGTKPYKKARETEEEIIKKLEFVKRCNKIIYDLILDSNSLEY